MKFSFYTLGCKVNQYETAAMERTVEAAGHTVVSVDGQPDVFVINSCTVTAESDRKTRQLVRKFRSLLPSAAIVLTGCMPQAFPADAEALDAADIVLGNSTNTKLIDSVNIFFATGERVINIGEHKRGEKFDTPTIDRVPERTRAYIKIEDGCERFCTYCIIPYARGRVRSKSIEQLHSEVCELAHSGYKEIVLVGINLSAFDDGGRDLADAVESAAQVDGIERVRLGSLEPDMMSDGMLARLAACDKFCPQFHLSLQSGCDRTLKAMNRHYDTAFYRDLCNRIRRTFDNATITTDIMVGFPGESDDDFEQSLAFAEEIGFEQAHIFAYSRRDGTPAAKASGQVTRAVKEERSRRMIAAMKQCRTKFLQGRIGHTVRVLLESEHRGRLSGYTENYTPVTVDGTSELSGQIVSVEIIGTDGDCCIGKII